MLVELMMEAVRGLEATQLYVPSSATLKGLNARVRLVVRSEDTKELVVTFDS